MSNTSSANSWSMMYLLYQVFGYLSLVRKFQIFGLFILMIVSGWLEVLSLGAALPFLSVLSNPDSLWSNSYTLYLANIFNWTSPDDLLLPVTIVFCFIVFLASSARLLILWISTQLISLVGSDISKEVYSRTLYQPYIVHAKRNSSIIINALTAQVASFLGSLTAFFQLSASLFTSISLTIGILLVSWQIAASAIAVFGIIYLIIAYKSRSELTKNGELINSASIFRIRSLQEGLGAIRDVVMSQGQNLFINLFAQSDRSLRQLQARNAFISGYPRYVLEAVGLVLIAVLGLFLVLHHGGGFGVLPILGTLALGAQRLLPAFQSIYSSWTQLKATNPSVYQIHQLLCQPYPKNHNLPRLPSPFYLSRSIVFSNLAFTYSQGSPFVLNNINLSISVGERIGIVGSTGSGKSTFMDLLMGLLTPSFGTISIDGFNLHDPNNPQMIVDWRSSVAHVPQSIFLTDSTILENIALGIPKEDIDLDHVKVVARQAQIDEYIESRPHSYNTIVGERGIQLSGGQRQRIGIARALYKKASILVFDEATSALDLDTETALMNSIDSLSRHLTIIMIAHRISTLQCCDRIFNVSNASINEIPAPHMP